MNFLNKFSRRTSNVIPGGFSEGTHKNLLKIIPGFFFEKFAREYIIPDFFPWLSFLKKSLREFLEQKIAEGLSEIHLDS